MSSSRATFRHVEVPHAGLALVCLAVVAVALILYLTRRFNFYFDEWAFVVGVREWTFKSYFLPHNEHWSTVPMLVYRVLFATVGLRAYTPYLATLLVMHTGVAVLLFSIVRRRAGDLLALASGALLLFLGYGWEDLMWAFQISFVGSVLFGLLAIYLLDRPAPRPPVVAAASAALLLSLMSSGVGLSFLVAVAVDLLLDRRKRSRLPVLVVPALAYAAWFLAVGARASSVHRSPLSWTALSSLVSYVPFGVGAAVAGLFGLPARFGEAALAILAAGLGISWFRGRWPPPLVVASCAGILVQYSLSGLIRSQFGDVQAGSSRYVYIASVFLLLILGDTLRELPWRGLWRPAFLAVLLAAVALNGYELQRAAHARNGVFVLEDADLQTLNVFRDSTAMDRDAVVDLVVIGSDLTPRKYYSAVDAMGSPVPAQTLAGLRGLPPTAVDGTLARLFPAELSEGTAGPQQCTTPLTGPDLEVPGGGAALLAITESAPVKVYVWYLEPPSTPTFQTVMLRGGTYVVRVAATSPPITWRARIDAPGYTAVTACPRPP